MTIDRGTAEGQWQTWLQRLPWDGWIDEPGALQIWGYASRLATGPATLSNSASRPPLIRGVSRCGATASTSRRSSKRPVLQASSMRCPPIPLPMAVGGRSVPALIPSDWVSGGYIVVLRGAQWVVGVSGRVFVLRAVDPGARSKLALVVATYSWQ